MFKRNKLPEYPSRKWTLDLFVKENSLQLKQYISTAYQQKFSLLLQKYIENDCQLVATNYNDILRILVYLEDAFVVRNIAKYVFKKQKVIEVLNDQTLLIDNQERKYKYVIQDTNQIPRDIEEGDFIILADSIQHTSNFCRIIKMIDMEIEFTPCRKERLIDVNRMYDLKFKKDRTATRMELHALSTMTTEQILFPTKLDDIEFVQKNIRFEWLSKFLCKEQKQAVVNIVNNSAYPAPYILYGPPGTGKTITLVEAVAQIWKLKSETRILVTAHSNTACDEIALRLLKLKCIPDEDIFRYYSMSQLRKSYEIDEELKRISNLRDEWKERYIEQHIFKEFKIVVCTLVMSGRMACNGLEKGTFDYIFIDEAGSATEPSAIIPIQGFVSGSIKPTNIILAGDPKQLGPVIKCRQAESLGLGQSMLERLMKVEMYKPDPVTGKYNTNVLTHLFKNFRSHPDILHVPNTLFYDGNLLACAISSKINRALGWKELPNCTVPIIFCAIKGETKNDKLTFSKFNMQELYEVLKYVKKLLTNGIKGRKVGRKEIGIISPYKKQCELIKKWIWCLDKNGEIEVDTVEKFQGQEREIIIVSTVRSKTEEIGFLDNAKRTNVTLTRAKSLLIVLGDPDTLQIDKNWAQFINFCKKRCAYCEKLDPFPNNVEKLLQKFKWQCLHEKVDNKR